MSNAARTGWSGTRREFTQITLGGIASAVAGARLLAIDSTIGGVKVGAISYCFRSIPRPPSGDYVDTLIDAFKQVGLGLCELESVRVEPEPAIPGGGRIPAPITPEYTKRRGELRQWRLTAPMDRFKEIKSKFDKAGIELMGYVMTFSEDFTDEEIDRTFLAAKTLGVKIIGTNQTRVPMGKRLAPFADKYDVVLGWHNHAMVDDPTASTTTTPTTVAAAETPACPTPGPAVTPTFTPPPVDPAAPPPDPWDLSSTADPSWGTSKKSGTTKSQRVNGIVEHDGIAYFGGEFTKMTPPGGGTTATRNHLAAVDGATGQLTSWNPNASGNVFALALSADGDWVYVGGDFSSIGGKSAPKLARIRLEDGKIDPNFRPKVNSRVRAITLDGDRLYVGGNFTTIGGQPRPELAAIDPITGALLPWTPPALGRGRYIGHTGIPTPDYSPGYVFSIAVIGGKVFAAGNFLNIGCQGGLVTIDAATGGLVEPQYDPGRPIFDLTTYGGVLYAVGGGPGGTAYAFSPDDQKPLWKVKVDGVASTSRTSAGGRLGFSSRCVTGTWRLK